MTIQNKAPLVAGITAFILANIKLLVGLFSGSMTVLSSAIDSIMDAVISGANFIASRQAGKKPNEKFNYGFAKLEAIMSLLEGFFIAGIGLFLVYTSFVKVIYPPEVIKIDIALYVMIFSCIVTAGLLVYLKKVAKISDSLIIKADILHYKTDLYTNFGIILALIIIKFTALIIIDALFGIIIGAYIFISAIKLIVESGKVLVDRAVGAEIVGDIERFIDEHDGVTSHHEIKTRQIGSNAFFTAHIVFNPKISLYKAHMIGNEIENYINDTYKDLDWDINLHFDPVDDQGESAV